LHQSCRLQASQVGVTATQLLVDVAPSPCAACVAVPSAPGKCETEMSSASFRTRSLPMNLAHLHAGSSTSLDSRYTREMWMNLTPVQALENIEGVVLVSTNQVKLWTEFFSDFQAPDS
ncbi:hypothetical protein SK128_023126, partial [Halocaridina rubra]